MENDDGHTKGSWLAVLGHGSEDYWVTEDDIVVAQCYNPIWGDDKCEANTRLIAAAPELLDALQRILFEDSDKSEADRLKDRVFARAAIEKANGRNDK